MSGSGESEPEVSELVGSDITLYGGHTSQKDYFFSGHVTINVLTPCRCFKLQVISRGQPPSSGLVFN